MLANGISPLIPPMKDKLPPKPSLLDFKMRNHILSNDVSVDSAGDCDKYDKVISTSCKAGFSNLPNQIHRKAVQRGFVFNLMVTGSPGLGKSSFLNALFCSDVYNDDHVGPSKRSNSKGDTVVHSQSLVACGRHVNLRLSILDTPGFGQNVDNSGCWQPIVECMDSRFESYLRSELSVNRVTVGSGAGGCPTLRGDNRVHACLYFVAPTVQSLHQLDIETMKHLSDKVNLIVIIGKADTLTLEECLQMKAMVSQQLEANNIQVYNFPESVTRLGAGGTDEKWLQEVLQLRKRQPFAVVSGDRVIEHADGKKVRGRVYPWGVVETENLKHNDFSALQSLLLDVHLQDLMDVTHTKHYANYFSSRLLTIAEASRFTVSPDGREPLSQLEAERVERQRTLAKMEAEMEWVFEQKVHQRTVKLAELEHKMDEEIFRLKQHLATELTVYEKKRQDFEQERAHWEAENRETLELIRGSMEKLDVKEKMRTKKKGFFQSISP